MNLVLRKILFIISLSLSFILMNPAQAIEWPTESLLTIQNLKYGRQCLNCTAVFSRGYCAPTCCDSCMSEASKSNLNIPDACSGVCHLEQTPTADDVNHEKKCKESNYSLRGCDQLKQYIGNLENDDFRRLYQRRVESCDEAIADTKANCQEAKLDKAYPADLFNLAKEIVEAPSCDFEKVENYNLKTNQANPQQVIGLCDKSYNECKKYCNDENTVYGEIDGQRTSRTYAIGQQNFEGQCQPIFAKFNDKKAIREEFILEANNTVLSCQSSESVDTENRVDEGSEDGDFDSLEPIATPETAKSTPNPSLARNNPEVAMNNINGIISAFQPFIPVNQGNYNPSLYNSTSEVVPTAQRYGLSESEMYGPDYSGWDVKDTNDIEYLDVKDFDKPDSLKKQNAGTRDNSGSGTGNSMGALGGSSGSNSGPSNKSGPRTNAGKKKPKDKTLFGKSLGGGSNSYASSSSAPDRKNSKNGLGRGSGMSGRSSLFNSERKFDASKYHQAIMASYQKGMKSKAQIRAERRAAGLSLESKDEKLMRGYTLWHQDNKIHPDTISLFMQAKICYHTKFSTNFKSTCEFSRP